MSASLHSRTVVITVFLFALGLLVFGSVGLEWAVHLQWGSSCSHRRELGSMGVAKVKCSVGAAPGRHFANCLLCLPVPCQSCLRFTQVCMGRLSSSREVRPSRSSSAKCVFSPLKGH